MPVNDSGGSVNATNLDLYGYDPGQGLGVTYTLFFGILTLIHLYFLFKTRYWKLTLYVLGGLFETAGWYFRTKSADDSSNITDFVVQLGILVVAPSFIAAFNYSLFSQIIDYIPAKTWIKKWMYRWIFIVLDIIGFILQSVGGLMGAKAAHEHEDLTTATNVMLIGIIIGLLSMILFCTACVQHVIAARRYPGYDRPVLDNYSEKYLKYLTWSFLISTVCLLIRYIYRTFELAPGGLDREIMKCQWSFVVFEATPILISLLIFALFNPGLLLALIGAPTQRPGQPPINQIKQEEKVLEQIVDYSLPRPHSRPQHQDTSSDGFRIDSINPSGSIDSYHAHKLTNASYYQPQTFLNNSNHQELNLAGPSTGNANIIQQNRPPSVGSRNPYASVMSAPTRPLPIPTRNDSLGTYSKSSYPSTPSLGESAVQLQLQSDGVALTHASTILRSAFSPDSDHRKSFFSKA